MNAQDRDHPNEEALERFLLHQSDEEELDIVETHILACEMCVTRLETLELNIAATKMALQSLEAEQLQKQAQPAAAFSFWKRWFTLPRLTFAGAALAACTFALSWVAVPRQVTLMAYRGTEVTQVPEFRPLQLNLDAPDFAAGPVRVAVVNSNGTTLWQGMSAVKDNRISVRGPRLTSSGAYYVRVFAAPDQSGDEELLREFSIKAKPTW